MIDESYPETESFIKLVNFYLNQKRTKLEIQNALYSLEIFLYKFPQHFCNYVRSNITRYQELKRRTKFSNTLVTFSKSAVSSNTLLMGKIRNLILSLQKRGGVIIFVLHDGAILQECFRIMNPKNLVSFSIRVSRKELDYSKKESFKKYLYFFSEINNTSLKEKDKDWSIFFKNYCSRLYVREIKDSNFRNFSKLVRDSIDKKIPQIVFKLQVPFTVVDTGLQGTFAIFLCWLLRKYKKVKDVDFRLISCYPWLPKFFQIRSFSKNIKHFPLLESSVINQYSRSLPFFGRIINSNSFRIETAKLRRILNAKK